MARETVIEDSNNAWQSRTRFSGRIQSFRLRRMEGHPFAPCEGEERDGWGTPPTDYYRLFAQQTPNRTRRVLSFTGQREEAEIGLYFYQTESTQSVRSWYDSQLGHFAQADSIITGTGNSKAYDRFSYALGNPIMYIDRNGHDPAGPSLDGGDILPPVVNPGVLELNLATSVDKNTKKSQYYPYESVDKPASGWGYNLCGQIVLSAILETENPGMDYSLGDIWENGTDSTTEATTGYKLLCAIDAVFPESQLWNVMQYSYSSINILQQNQIMETEELDHNWWLDSEGNDIVQSILYSAIQKSHYMIVLVAIDSQDTYGSGYLVTNNEPNHWVCIIGMNKDWVEIYNPFNNSYQIYPWYYFQRSMANQYGAYHAVEVWQTPQHKYYIQ